MESSGQHQQHAPHDSGHSVDSKDLQHEVQALREKDVDAAVRLADYEDEVRRLKRQLRKQASLDTTNQSLAAETPQQAPALSRWGSVLNSRRPTPPTHAPQSQAHPTAREKELEAQLTTERSLRQAAESKVQEVQNEIEDLSASLFTEANEMVAEERRTNAKLAERVRVLEARERERKARLERLEEAVGRIERVRGVLRKR
ncbi:hypothetical protein MBLNU230_g4503t1 [Neophaeotheca triangularis]